MSKLKIDLNLITKEMEELKDNKARYEFEIKNIKKEIEKRELQLIALMSQFNVDEMQHGVYSWKLKEISRTALDQGYFKDNFNDIYEKCVFTKTGEKFEFRIN